MEVGDGVLIATADGDLIHASIDPSRGESSLHQDAVEYSGAVPLNAVEASGRRTWAAGDEGTLLEKSHDGDWEIVDLDTDARLLDVVAFEYEYATWLVVVGDGVVRAKHLDTGTWHTPPEPDGGWGELRAVFGDGERIWAVGAAGVAWVCTNPSEAWTAEDVGLGDVDLNGGGQRWSMDATPLAIVGDRGSYASFNGVRWTPTPTNINDDLVDYAGGVALSRDGRLFDVTYGDLGRVDKVEGLNRALFKNDTDVIVVGEGGRGRTHDIEECFCC